MNSYKKIVFETRPKSRYAKDKYHSSYGIYKWFKSYGVKDQQTMSDIVNEYCNQYKNDRLSRIEHCSKHFAKFADFALTKIVNRELKIEGT